MRPLSLHFDSPFINTPRKNHIPVVVLQAKNFPEWLRSQNKVIKTLCTETGFEGRADKILAVRDSQGQLEKIILGMRDDPSIYASSSAIPEIRRLCAKSFLKTASFVFEPYKLSADDITRAHIGWAMGCYDFNTYKDNGTVMPLLVWSKGVDKKHVISIAEALFMLRNLVNAPANDMGPDEIEAAARFVATPHKAEIRVIKDKELLTKNFPLIHAVGHGSDRRPRLIDVIWGNQNHPRLTLVGKGVAFDTGGLNIKPSSSMALMKKDMGGAAHVLALGKIIMDHKIPVRLRILIAAVENSISGSAFRPGDIFTSRKGITVENTNTDAEGRLILADTLTYACEDKPDLLIDFATLTGSARAALGPEIPPVFSNNASVAETLKSISWAIDDPVWPMPLWPAYRKMIESPVADFLNSSSAPGDLMYSALFLQQFLQGTPDWLHLDVYAWEHVGRPGRPRGGAETGLRAVLGLIEQRYGQQKKKRR
jgi:leucyl aminopeptidase